MYGIEIKLYDKEQNDRWAYVPSSSFFANKAQSITFASYVSDISSLGVICISYVYLIIFIIAVPYS